MNGQIKPQAVKRMSFRVDRKYLSRKQCLIRAREIKEAGLIDMEEKELAMEIFFHTRIYYWFRRLYRLPVFSWMVDRADPIDIADGGDTPLRKFFFRVLWII